MKNVNLKITVSEDGSIKNSKGEVIAKLLDNVSFTKIFEDDEERIRKLDRLLYLKGRIELAIDCEDKLKEEYIELAKFLDWPQVCPKCQGVL